MRRIPKNILLFLIFSLLAINCRAQEYPRNFFAFPLDTSLALSGTFAELRGNHFHAGIDLKTYGKEGLNVYAAADGYVSRIKVSPYGYGKAIYVTHSNGYTTVYGHLSKFSPQIEAYVKKEQYIKKTYSIELFPAKISFKVKKGDLIAFSGNTGGSSAPHLHFEIRDTKTEEIIDPKLFGMDISDAVAPEIRQVYLYEKNEQFRQANGIYNSQPLTRDSSLTFMTSPGVYALGTEIDERCCDKENPLGTYRLRILLNDQPYFERSIGRFSFLQTHLVNVYLDPREKANNKYVELCFDKNNVLPDNFTRMEKNGFFRLAKNELLKIEVIAEDYGGNKTSRNYLLYGDTTRTQQPTNTLVEGSFVEVLPEKIQIFRNEQCMVDFPAGSFYDTAQVSILTETDENGNTSLHFGKGQYFPQKGAVRVSLKVNEQTDAKLIPKLLIVSEEGESYSSTYNNGFISTQVKKPGRYFIRTDVDPPLASIESIDKGLLTVSINDAISGIGNYTAYLNNSWFLMEYDAKSGILKGDLSTYRKGEKLDFKLIVTDNKNNLYTLQENIKIL